MTLERYSGKRFAVLFAVGGHHRLMKGMASYGEDPILGPTLAIELDASAKCRSRGAVLHVQEGRFKGNILAGQLFGCDCCIEVDTDMGEGA